MKLVGTPQFFKSEICNETSYTIVEYQSGNSDQSAINGQSVISTISFTPVDYTERQSERLFSFKKQISTQNSFKDRTVESSFRSSSSYGERQPEGSPLTLHS